MIICLTLHQIYTFFYKIRKKEGVNLLSPKELKLPVLSTSAVFLFLPQIYLIFVKNKKKTIGSFFLKIELNVRFLKFIV